MRISIGMKQAAVAKDRRPSRLASKILSQAVLLVFAFSSVFPIYFMISTAFKTRDEYLMNTWGLPIQPTLATIQRAFERGSLLLWFRNSVTVTVITVVIVTLLASLAAYATSKMDFRGRMPLLKVLVSLMVMPPIVMVIPLFILMVRLGLVNNFISVILIYAGLLSPFSVYLLNSFFRSVHDEILAAAAIDGCSTFQIFRYIMLPLSLPALTTLVIVNVLWVWNELQISLIFLQGNEIRTFMAGLTQFQGRFAVDQPLVMAGAMMGMLPIMLLYLFGQRYFVRGLTAGAVK